MNNYRKVLFNILIFYLFTSCTNAKTVTVPRYFKFEKKTTLCIADFKDRIDNTITSDLNYYLINAGFNLINLSSVKKAIQYKGSFLKYTNNEITEVLSVTDLQAVDQVKISFKKKCYR